MVREPQPGAKEDPHWPRASSWLSGDMIQGTADDQPVLAVLGVPLSQGSIPPNGSHLTPQSVREALARFSPFAAGVGLPDPVNVDLCTILPIDLGDVSLVDLDNVSAQDEVRRTVSEIGSNAKLPRAPDLTVFLGGDDCIIRPTLKGYVGDLGSAGLLTLDAHHDVRAFYRNMGPHNGSPVRGLIDDGLPGSNIVEIGISAFGNSAFYRQYCDEHGITVVEASRARAEGVALCVQRQLDALAGRCDIIFVDLDLDVIECAYGPACPGARPGGLAPWEVHEAAVVVGANSKVRGVCVVEVDPAIDAFGTGVDNAALCLLHSAAGLALR